MRKVILGLLAVGSVMSASAAQDWSGLSTDITAEITAVLPIALAVFGAVLAVTIGKKVFKRLVG